MMINYLLTLFLTLLAASHSKTCLGIDGRPVVWWVQLIFPGKLNNGFAYIDDRYVLPLFQIHREKADTEFSAIGRTLQQINTFNLQLIAWNDQTPTGQTSSTKAHSKGVLAFDDQFMEGFYFGHSIPMYPSFNETIVNFTINTSQSVYAQHAFCITLDFLQLRDDLNRILPMKPFIFERHIKNESKYVEIVTDPSVAQPNYQSLFTFKDYFVGTTQMKFIFKNGAQNGSIFEDGLNNMLNSQLVAETWGRPIQPPWCVNPYPVTNVQKIVFNSQIQWTETQDHSKWLYTVNDNFSCFGDMNRMASQWKRGGAFYCIKSEVLKSALLSISKDANWCTQVQELN